MKLKNQTRKPSNRIGGYFVQPVKEPSRLDATASVEFKEQITELLRGRSKLLRLTDSDVDRDDRRLFQAYLSDVEGEKSFATHLENGVHGGIIAGIRINASERNGEAQRRFHEARCQACAAVSQKWEQLQSELPQFPRPSFGTLDSKWAGSTTPAQLLAELQELYLASCERYVRDLHSMLCRLRELNFLGDVRWSNDHICSYDYVHHCVDETGTRYGTSTSEDFYGDRPFGQRTVQTTVHRRTVTVRHSIECHTHNNHAARRIAIPDYRKKVPAREAAFLDSLDASLLPCVHIVEGDIFKEIVRRWDVGEETYVTDVIVQEKYSPGVILGGVDGFALAGWNGDDLRGPTRFLTRR